MDLLFEGGFREGDTDTLHYPAEQMMTTLFPGEPTHYAERETPGENRCIFAFSRGKKRCTVCVRLRYEGKEAAGRAAFAAPIYDTPERERRHALSRAVKRAMYAAGRQICGDLPWGALTGVRPGKMVTGLLAEGKSVTRVRRELIRTYHLSPPRVDLALTCASESRRVKGGLSADETELYIGIPFCPSRCLYCSFVSSRVERENALREPFVRTLLREIEEQGGKMREKGKFTGTFYMGGGTPTTLTAEQLRQIFDALHRCFPWERCRECTVEAGRPDTVTEEKLRVLRAAGVNRLSINPQTMRDAVLKIIGRRHTAADIVAAFDAVRRIGGFAVNCDLIAGLPGDTFSGFCDSLRRIIALKPENITVHTLARKKGADLWGENTPLPGAAAVGEMVDFARETLRDAGYEPYYLYRQKYTEGGYENVGYTLPGFACEYNVIMNDELTSVLALGGGGVSKDVDGETGKITRRSHPKYAGEYIASFSGEDFSHPATSTVSPFCTK